MIQSGNWRVARDTVWELEGHVMQVTHYKPIIQHEIAVPVWYRPNLPVPAQIPRNRYRTGPEPEFWSVPSSYLLI